MPGGPWEPQFTRSATKEAPSPSPHGEWLIAMTEVRTAPRKIASSRAFEASPEICAMLQTVGKALTLPRRTTLFRQGDVPKGVFVILTGKVALSAGDHACRVTRIAAEHSLLGLPSTVGNRRYTLTAQTLTDVEVYVVPPEVFRKSLASNPTLGMAIVKILSDEVSALRKLSAHKP